MNIMGVKSPVMLLLCRSAIPKAVLLCSCPLRLEVSLHLKQVPAILCLHFGKLLLACMELGLGALPVSLSGGPQVASGL